VLAEQRGIDHFDGLWTSQFWCIDEALEMCIAGAWVALFHEIGYEVDVEKFGKECPSRRTISRYDVHGSCCCLFVC
jgi:hypothetical protein